MEKKQAQEYIEKVLSSRFDQENFEQFTRNLLNDFEAKNNIFLGDLIPKEFIEHVVQYERVGTYTDPEGELLDILVVQTHTVGKLERTRTVLRNFVVRHLKNFEKQFALVAFYSKEDDGADWRLSLVKIDYESHRDNEGKIKITEELIPAKRFSFLVGENEHTYTAQKQLLPLLLNDYSNPLIVKEEDGDGSIEGAFSIEKVTDEFYEQYKELYLKLTESEQITKALLNENLNPVQFVKKLLGQIVFLYFLQKKGWLGVPKDSKMGEGSKRFLQDRYNSIEKDGKNYFNDFLKYLFYAALAREHNDGGIKYYIELLKCKIPFLNGGLFEAEYDWQNITLDVPNHLFRNKLKNSVGDKGTGILDVFDRFNFTIKEDELLEKEVAVDPEMLGKVFENMLEITERKSKGAFYTPREIVHYMCQESLIHYLDNVMNSYTDTCQAIDSDRYAVLNGSSEKKGQLKIELEHKGNIKVPKEHIQNFIRFGHLVLESEGQASKSYRLNKGTETKSSINKNLLNETIWNNAKELDRALAEVKICDPAIGSGAFPVGMLHEIIIARQVLNEELQIAEHTTYCLKRHAIQQSIYGVDIDPSATDIARLRLWLSMIVDEEDYDSIEPLPNLDYKIVCGNSLVGLPENTFQDLVVEKELKVLKDAFFDETDELKKKSLRSQINNKIQQLLESSEQYSGYRVDFDYKLFFSEVWSEEYDTRGKCISNGGFDIVIGNPPYGLLNKKQNQNFAIRVNTAHLNYFKNAPLYKSASGGVLNIFRLFISKSGSILNKKTGVFAEIFPLAFTGDVTSKDIRKHIFSNFKIHGIEAFPERDNENKRVFKHAKMSVCVLFFSKCEKPTTSFYLRIHDDKYIDYTKEKLTLSFEEIKSLDPLYLTIPVLSKKDLGIMQKVYSSGKRVSDYTNCFTGEIDLSLDKKYIRQDSSFSKLLKGAIIGRYEIRSKMSQGEIEYLDSDAYLRENKGKRATHFKESRIGMQGITGVNEKSRLKMALIPSGVFLANSVNYIIMPKGVKQNKFVLAQLNSELLNYLFKLSSTNSNVNGYEINNLPIVAEHIHESGVCKLVDYLLFYNGSQAKSENTLLKTFFDNLLNASVYELFFPKEFKSSDKEILMHLDDIDPIKDDMSDEEKLAVLNSEFNRLYNPYHPVRNNLESLGSINEVKIIKDALK